MKKTLLFVAILFAAANLFAQNTPKNIIVLISDGWGYNQIAATNYYHAIDSQSFEKFPVMFPMSTYPATTDDVPDIDVNDFGVGYNSREAWTNPDYIKHGYTGSAPAATTMASGQKSAKYAIGVDIKGENLELITERAIALGKSAGVVSSVQYAHATPAAFSVHNISRNNYDEIAISYILDSKLSVVMGCGHPHFDKNADTITDAGSHNYFYVGGQGTWDSLKAGATTFDSVSINGNSIVQDIDNDDDPDAWTMINDSIDFVNLASGSTPKRVIGIPKVYKTLQNNRASGKLNGEVFDSMNVGIPTLEQMTEAALNVLDNNSDGLFLMVEGGAIDWAGHGNDIERIIEEQTDFNNTVNSVIAWVESNGGWNENLVIVTGDHETGYLAGPDYPEKDSAFATDTLIDNFGVVDNGLNNIPSYKFLSGGHTRQLIPFYAKGAGSDMFAKYADEEDFVRGNYIDNTDMGNAMFDLWPNNDFIMPTPKNVVLMISDGWGYNQIAATNYFHGETQAYEAWSTKYAMSNYPAMTGKVWQIDDINKWSIGYDPKKAWTDSSYIAANATGSAAAATAMYTGVKSAYYAIGVALDSAVLKTFGEKAYELGKSTGVVSSVEFMHATPAAMFAHNPSRKAYHDLTKEMLFDSKASVIMGCGAPDFDNDAQLLDTNEYKYIDSTTWAELLVGGTTQFTEESINNNNTVQDVDGDNNADAWTVIRDSADFVKYASGKTPLRLLGVPKVAETLQQSRTQSSDVAYADAFNRNVPTLMDMTKAAINVLDNNDKGFSLMVEGGAIDWAGHGNQLGRIIEEQNDFNNSVDAVISWIETNSNWDETLLIITGDHETGYLVGPNYSNADIAGTFAVTDAGSGNMPNAQFLSGGHTNQLIPIYIKGEGEDMFAAYADHEDPVRGKYMNNTEIGQAIFKMWAGVAAGIPNISTDSITSISEAFASSKRPNITVYPTVSNGMVNVRVENYPAEYRVVSLTGAIVETDRLTNYHSTVNLENLTSGIYFINIKDSENTTLNAKIIIQ